MSTHLKALSATPLLNTPDFDKIFRSPIPPLDAKGLFYPLEMIALPGTKFTIEKQISPYIYQVSTVDYPSGSLFLDIRSTEPTLPTAPEREKVLPSREAILASLRSSLGLPYIWGGNRGRGVPELQALYETPWNLSGLDCSGLLYEATNGFTPRNTSELLHFGTEVPSIEDVKPLDIFIWPGHVVIAVDATTIIESCYGKGVVLSPIQSRFSHQTFIIRRFI